MSITRRDFLKIAAVTGGVAAASTPVVKSVLALGKKPVSLPQYVPTTCEMCFWRCGVIAKVVDGKVVKLDGNPLHPNSRGKLCARGHGGIGLLYDSDRLKTPLINTGSRGEAKFKKASWDEALGYVADRMQKIKEKYGAESVGLLTHGTVSTYFMHLLQAFGSPNFAMPSFALCRGARGVAFELTFGEDVGNPERLDLQNSKAIVLIGSHLGENAHNSQCQEFAEAVGKGATVIVLDPRFSTAAGKAKYWLPIKPTTDLAILLAWINIIINEGLYDKDYVAKYTTGFNEVSQAVKEYTPEWAEKETEIPAGRIVETARVLGKNKPNVLIHPGRHTAWYSDNVQRQRAVAILTAILGAYGRPGGIYLNPKKKLEPVFLADKDYPEPQKSAINKGNYPFAGEEGVTHAIVKATLTEDPYPIKAWFITGTNIMKAMPNQRDTLNAVQRLDLLVAVDMMPYDGVMLADVVLPECTYLERHDDFFTVKERSFGISFRQPVVQPMYDTKPGWWIAKELGKRLGLEEYFPWNTFEDFLKAKAEAWGIDYAELAKKGYIDFPESAKPYLSQGEDYKFKTPSGKIELYSKELKKHGFDPIPKYTKHEQPSEGWFRLIYGRAPVHTFSRTTNNPSLWELMEENVAWINAKVAKRMGLKHGDYIVLVNQDGVKSNKVRAKVTERIRPDCIYLVHGFSSTSKLLHRAYLRGADDQQLITKYAIDPISGSVGMRVNFVKITKEV
ncbi:molybdopterin-containing oxidoreductase family protein [Thermodesulfovibrio yellowstonii]|uniref:molybdopterin-containing oxidoreductase family protein n=1 Tax=Thermodesulfovibrio yellowstonii TaxID=28262 RepID=UPI0024B3BBD3|nr:molybdopterin-dependent oxidoreductase [Thermodesulfovibrio yellowstonii]MDI6864081.1 molybdopterin-dependent oxidoreductase [Thermodesulfovibrio yellowstonii]